MGGANKQEIPGWMEAHATHFSRFLPNDTTQCLSVAQL